MDTGLCDHSSFEGCWADHPNGAVATLSIVVQFNVLEDLPSYRVPGLETLAMDRLDLETMKEAFSTGVIVTIALGAHAA